MRRPSARTALLLLAVHCAAYHFIEGYAFPGNNQGRTAIPTGLHGGISMLSLAGNRITRLENDGFANLTGAWHIALHVNLIYYIDDEAFRS